LSKEQHLDLLLLYLRRVHSYCFYCGEEYDDERTLAAKCGPQHLRNARKITRWMIDTEPQWTGSKNYEDKYVRAANERLTIGPQPRPSPQDDEVLRNMKQDYAELKTKVVQDGQVYQCIVKDCYKKFKSSEFVHKHIHNKHADVLDEKFNKSRFKDMFKENYFKDPKKLINYPQVSGSSGQYGGGSTYGSRGASDRGGRGGYRGGRYEDRGGEGQQQYRKNYVDLDDPNRYKD
jgi:hypothetical protein